MLRVICALLVFASTALAQSSSDGSFSVLSSKHEKSALSAAQMREAESLYQSACGAVQHDFHSASELHPHFTVLIGAERNEVHSAGMKVQDDRVQIWMKKWNPTVFAQGVVVLAFDELLTRKLITQLGDRAVSYTNATVDVAGLK